tara:strand:+ start:1086 stop:2051 length:966 start_codon:yes stop_codon:yes gene_type:complete
MGSAYKEKSFNLDFFGGDFKVVKKELKRLIQEFSKHKRWEVNGQNEEFTEFTTKISWASFGESVSLQHLFENNSLLLRAYTENSQLISWGKLEENVSTVIDFIGPKLQAFITEKESNRQNSNLAIVNSLKENNIVIEVNNDLTTKLKELQGKLEPSQIPNILKILNYYKEQVSNHNILIEDLNSVDFHKVPDNEIESISKGLEIYSSLVGLLEGSIILMFKCAKEADLIEFYEFYNNFESMGLFMTTGEKAVIQGINDINNNLKSLVAGIEILASGMFNMNRQLSVMSSQLADLKSGINVNNAIAAVNAYQTYQTRKAIKS